MGTGVDVNVSANSDQITGEAAAGVSLPRVNLCPTIPRQASFAYPATATTIWQPACGTVDSSQASHASWRNDWASAKAYRRRR